MSTEKAMPSGNFTPPTFGLDAFNCPHCGSYNEQTWYYTAQIYRGNINPAEHNVMEEFSFALCRRCHRYSIWINAKPSIMVYPKSSLAPRPHEDMPGEALGDFEEASKIVSDSPRGAAALLRLATEKLVGVLVEEKSGKPPSGNLNNQIGKLVKYGLPKTIQQALDSLRVIGNEAVHPGTLDLKDDQDTALKLFGLVNVIVENQISEPQAIQALYADKIPSTKKEEIEKRDASQ
jgi:hypothetical protein